MLSEMPWHDSFPNAKRATGAVPSPGGQVSGMVVDTPVGGGPKSGRPVPPRRPPKGYQTATWGKLDEREPPVPAHEPPRYGSGRGAPGRQDGTSERGIRNTAGRAASTASTGAARHGGTAFGTKRSCH